LEPRLQVFSLEAGIQWFGSQRAEEACGVIEQPYAAKFTGVVEPQMPSPIEMKDRMLKAIRGSVCGGKLEVPTHAQMNQQRSLIEGK
jgi:hypothetical protein